MTNGNVGYKVMPRFGDVDITVAEYRQLFVAWIKRLRDAGVSEDVLSFYKQTAETKIRQLLKGVDYEKLPIIPGTQEWHGMIWDRKLTARRPGDVSALDFSQIPYTFGQLGLQESALSIPFYREVVAPKAYEASAIAQAQQYGYEPDSTQWNTQLRKGIDASNAYINQSIANIIAEPYTSEQAALEERGKRGIVTGQTEEEIAEAQRKAVGYGNIAEQAFRSWGEQEAAQREKTAQQWAEQMQFAFPQEQPAPSAVPGVQKFLEEDRPAGLQGFVQEQLPSVLSKFEQSMAGARNAWWAAINQPTHQQALQEAQFEVDRWSKVVENRYKAEQKAMPKTGVGEEGAFPEARTVGTMSPDEWMMNIAPRKLQESMDKLGQIQLLSSEQASTAYPTTASKAAMEDPLEKYLKEYPFQSEFLRLSPSQRGFNYQRYSPSARWFTG